MLKRRALPLAMLLFGAGALHGQPAPVASGDFTPGSGVETVRARCTVCHPPTMITGRRWPRRRWGDVIDQMMSKGAQVSDEDYAVILDYLTHTYGETP